MIKKQINGIGTVKSFTYVELGNSTIEYISDSEKDKMYTFEITSSGSIKINKAIEPSKDEEDNDEEDEDLPIYSITTDSGDSGLTVGDEVATLSGESFYVIAIHDNEITLIAKYNLAIDKKDGKYYQLDTVDTSKTACAFATGKDTDTGEYAEGNAIEKAKEYGEQNGGTGRLLTFDEANSMITHYGDTSTLNSIVLGDYSSCRALDYWLGTASKFYNDFIYTVEGANEPTISDYKYDNAGFGVRPVIEIDEEKIDE